MNTAAQETTENLSYLATASLESDFDDGQDEIDRRVEELLRSEDKAAEREKTVERKPSYEQRDQTINRDFEKKLPEENFKVKSLEEAVALAAIDKEKWEETTTSDAQSGDYKNYLSKNDKEWKTKNGGGEEVSVTEFTYANLDADAIARHELMIDDLFERGYSITDAYLDKSNPDAPVNMVAILFADDRGRISFQTFHERKIELAVDIGDDDEADNLYEPRQSPAAEDAIFGNDDEVWEEVPQTISLTEAFAAATQEQPDVETVPHLANKDSKALAVGTSKITFAPLAWPKQINEPVISVINKGSVEKVDSGKENSRVEQQLITNKSESLSPFTVTIVEPQAGKTKTSAETVNVSGQTRETYTVPKQTGITVQVTEAKAPIVGQTKIQPSTDHIEAPFAVPDTTTNIEDGGLIREVGETNEEPQKEAIQLVVSESGVADASFEPKASELIMEAELPENQKLKINDSVEAAITTQSVEQQTVATDQPAQVEMTSTRAGLKTEMQSVVRESGTKVEEEGEEGQGVQAAGASVENIGSEALGIEEIDDITIKQAGEPEQTAIRIQQPERVERVRSQPVITEKVQEVKAELKIDVKDEIEVFDKPTAIRLAQPDEVRATVSQKKAETIKYEVKNAKVVEINSRRTAPIKKDMTYVIAQPQPARVIQFAEGRSDIVSRQEKTDAAPAKSARPSIEARPFYNRETLTSRQTAAASYAIPEQAEQTEPLNIAVTGIALAA